MGYRDVSMLLGTMQITQGDGIPIIFLTSNGTKVLKTF